MKQKKQALLKGTTGCQSQPQSQCPTASTAPAISTTPPDPHELWLAAIGRLVTTLDSYMRQQNSASTVAASPPQAPTTPPTSTPSDTSATGVIRLRLWRSHPGRVLFDGRPVTLGRCAWRLLCLLARYPGQVVSYDDMSGIWLSDVGGVGMSHKQLQAHRMALNQSFGCARDDENDGIISLVHGCGFCLELTASEILIE
ncbi:hypothetical protein GX645_00175 [Candidatus Sumerlaeota bacterium]|nr:hypothetical protein [Candidatus Sumerlaeota bacterium]